ncbi:MAG TPA: hypothetical protein VNW52_06100 [Burkholderiaceae bacterium]|nr:hypothetical protein [Burkholderiaceae bacterium]
MTIVMSIAATIVAAVIMTVVMSIPMIALIIMAAMIVIGVCRRGHGATQQRGNGEQHCYFANR